MSKRKEHHFHGGHHKIKTQSIIEPFRNIISTDTAELKHTIKKVFKIADYLTQGEITKFKNNVKRQILEFLNLSPEIEEIIDFEKMASEMYEFRGYMRLKTLVELIVNATESEIDVATGGMMTPVKEVIIKVSKHFKIKTPYDRIEEIDENLLIDPVPPLMRNQPGVASKPFYKKDLDKKKSSKFSDNLPPSIRGWFNGSRKIRDDNEDRNAIRRNIRGPNSNIIKNHVHNKITLMDNMIEIKQILQRLHDKRIENVTGVEADRLDTLIDTPMILESDSIQRLQIKYKHFYILKTIEDLENALNRNDYYFEDKYGTKPPSFNQKNRERMVHNI